MRKSAPLLAPAFYRIDDVENRLNLGRTAIYRLLRHDQSFPRRVQIAARATGWRRDEIEAWIDARPRKVDPRADHS